MANPYLQQQADAITSQYNNNLQQNILPSINSNAIAAGGFGGSRQGIAQGLAIGQSNLGLGNALGNLYGNAYENDQNRALQQQGLNNSYALGQGQLALGNRQADQNYSLGMGNLGLGQTQAANNYALGQGQLDLGRTQAANNYSLGQRAADTSQYGAETSRGLGYGQLQQQGDQNAFNNQLAGYGAQLQGLNSLMNWNNLGLGWANQQQQTPLNNLTQLTNIGTTIGGQGGTASTPYYGNPWLGALGGAQLGSNIFGNLFGG